MHSEVNECGDQLKLKGGITNEVEVKGKNN